MDSRESIEAADLMMSRMNAALAGAGVSRSAVQLEMAECHKVNCASCKARPNGDPDAVMSIMAYGFREAIREELFAKKYSEPQAYWEGPADG